MTQTSAGRIGSCIIFCLENVVLNYCIFYCFKLIQGTAINNWVINIFRCIFSCFWLFLKEKFIMFLTGKKRNMIINIIFLSDSSVKGVYKWYMLQGDWRRETSELTGWKRERIISPEVWHLWHQQQNTFISHLSSHHGVSVYILANCLTRVKEGPQWKIP